MPHGIGDLLERLRLSLWFIPALFALAAGVGAWASLTADHALSRESAFFLFGGSADGARSVLSAVAQSMLTFTGLVFTVTMLVLQLASSQLSPRVMRTFLRDRKNQTVLGLFVATFLYTLLILREVRSANGGDEFVPGLSIWLAFALLLMSVGAFVFYIDHMAHAIRASTVIWNIGNETRAAIERLYPEERDEAEAAAIPATPAAGSRVVLADRPGTLTGVDENAVISAAQGAGVWIELVPFVGDFVPEGAPMFRVHGQPREDGDGAADEQGQARRAGGNEKSLDERLRDALSVGEERTLQQDVAFGLRQLVDVAARALSPGTNDPTTAVQAIDQLHDLLRRLAARPFPSPVRRDDDGAPRLVLRQPGWDDYLALAFDELRLYGETHLQIARRLRAALLDLSDVTDGEQHALVRTQLNRLDEAVERGFRDRGDREEAMRPSLRGHGPVER